MSDDNTTLTIYLSLTSSPSTPRAPLILENNDSANPSTAAELRRKASEITTVPLSTMKLIFRGRVIPDKDEGDVVKEFKLEDGSVVHVMGKPAAAASGAANAASVGAAASGTGATVSTAGASVSGRVTMPTTNNAAGASSSSPLTLAFAKLQSLNDGPTYRTALTTADKLLGNIVSHPMEEKYRTIKKSNPAFSKRLGGLPGGSDLMNASGFNVETREGVEYYVLTPSADAWPGLIKAREEVQRVLLTVDRSSSVQNVVPPSANAAGAAAGGGASTLPGGMPNLFPGGMPGGGGLGGSAGDMSMIQSMLSDPNMLQNVMGMMNNPGVQNMMRNDPRFANNPMLQQSLNALQSNPEMINQFSQMMSDPNVRDRMTNMMSQQQQTGGAGGGPDPFSNGPDAMRRQMEQFQQMSQQFGGSSGGFNTGGGAGSGMAGASAAGPGGGGGQTGTSSNTNNGTGAGGNGDSDMTEEEMIAEAIARSLRES
ncbi:hypothetical protein ACHAXR_006386 [Thalassiosira sp. AJA248-18]